MKFYMLYESRFGQLPEGIKELQCFDKDMHVIPQDRGPAIKGRSVILEGTEEDILAWVDEFNSFWMGVGQPFQEQFKLMTKEKNMTQGTNNQFRDKEFAQNIVSELKKQLADGEEFSKADTQYIEAAYEQLGRGLHLSRAQVDTLMQVRKTTGEHAIVVMA